MSYWLSRCHPIQAWVEVSQQPFFGENYETDSTWICSFRVVWNYAKNLLKSAVFAKTKSNLAQNRVKFCRKMLSHQKTGSNFAKKQSLILPTCVFFGKILLPFETKKSLSANFKNFPRSQLLKVSQHQNIRNYSSARKVDEQNLNKANALHQ